MEHDNRLTRWVDFWQHAIFMLFGKDNYHGAREAPHPSGLIDSSRYKDGVEGSYNALGSALAEFRDSPTLRFRRSRDHSQETYEFMLPPME